MSQTAAVLPGRAAPEPAIRLQKRDKPLHKFLQAEPKALGATLLMFAAALFGFGFPLHFGTPSFFSGLGVSWWLSLLFVVSGTLAVVCGECPDKPRVTACMAVNIVNGVGTAIALIICCVDIFLWLAHRLTTTEGEQRHLVLQVGLSGFLTLVSLMGFILNLTLSVFCCRGLRYCSPSSSMPVVVVSGVHSDNPSCSSAIASD